MLLTMRVSALVLACVACISQGRKTQTPSKQLPGVLQREQPNVHQPNPLKVLQLLLLGLDSAAGWQAAGARNLASYPSAKEARSRSTATRMQGVFEQIKSQLEEQGRKDVKMISGNLLEADGKKAFWKVGTGGSSAGVDLLQYESEGLRRMADASEGKLAVPRPWLVGQVNQYGGTSGFIVMDKIRPAGGSAESQRQFGLGLAAMHSAAPADGWDPDLFGFPLDGCCGAFSQPNNAARKKMNWIEFWIEHRLKHQIAGIRDPEVHSMAEKIIAGMPKLFPFPIEEIKPSLLHGDLWSGNHGVDGDTGLPTIYDPAAYYGHDEADFGIANMFGGLTQSFYDAYFSVRPKKPGFEKRALLYELHHHLNHYNIFGGSYLGGAKGLMRQLVRELDK